MKLSIVSTLYLSSAHVPEFCRRAAAAAERLASDYEIILVNDGSPDDALERALSERQKNPAIGVLDLSRNFGHHKAMMTGLQRARGDLVFLIDCDLEEEPELMIQFHEHMRDTGADVVYGVQAQRQGGFFKRWTGELFYRLFNRLSHQKVPANQLVARLMTRRYVRSLVRHRDREIFIAGLWAATGYRQVGLSVQKAYKGSTTYGLRRRITMLVDAVTSFSTRPLVLMFYLGATIVLTSIAYATYLFVRKTVFDAQQPIGWPTLIISIWLLGGLGIFCMGLLGIYLSRVFAEAKRRPYTIVRKAYPPRRQDRQNLELPGE